MSDSPRTARHPATTILASARASRPATSLVATGRVHSEQQHDLRTRADKSEANNLDQLLSRVVARSSWHLADAGSVLKNDRGRSDHDAG